MKNLFDADFIKTIITQTITMKVRYSVSFLINIVLYTFLIAYLIQHQIFYWQFYLFILIGFISTTNLTAYIFFKIKVHQKAKERQKQRQEQENRLLKVFINYCAPLFEELDSIEKLILIDIARSYTKYTVIKSKLEPIEETKNRINELGKKLSRIELTIKITNTYPNILVETDEITKRILKEYFNIK